jgi:hypothetical protein
MSIRIWLSQVGIRNKTRPLGKRPHLKKIGASAAALVMAPWMLLAATPAFASDINNVHICLVHGTQDCVGAPTLGSGDKVELTSSGRTINELDKGNGFWRLQFDADHTKCVGVASSRNLTVRDCSEGAASNVDWGRFSVSGGINWSNSSLLGLMGSDNTPGDQLVDCLGSCSGLFELWDN